jgi:surface polysaccharide O-acyltransferase-like enzyme
MIWLDNSRIVAILAVVFLHVVGGVIFGNNVGTTDWWFGNLYDSIFRWCVPAFVMISGALLLDPLKKEGLSTFYQKRLSRLLVPLSFWSAFFLLWEFLKGIVRGNKVSSSELLEKLLSGEPYYHMWFLYMILGLYVFVPFLRKLVEHLTIQELKLLVLFMFVVAGTNSIFRAIYSEDGHNLFINRFLAYLPYFITGYIIRHTKNQPSKLSLFAVFSLSFLATFLGCYFFSIKISPNVGLYFRDYLSITVIPMSISVMYLLKTWESPIISESITKKLALLTFGVYLIHPIILEAINYKGLGARSFNPAFSVPTVAFFVFMAALAGAWLIHQIPYLRRVI